jgi:uncharacterized membrane protein YdbT with pleckstrin-like domain
MHYVNKILQPNETVIATAALHWIIYAPGGFLLLLAALIAIIGPAMFGFAVIFQPLAGLVMLFGLILLLRAWFEQWTTEIAVTSKRVIYKTGFISRSTTEMNMEKVESVAVDQNIWGRIFGYGTIGVRGTGVGMEELSRIADPLSLRNAIVAR